MFELSHNDSPVAGKRKPSRPKLELTVATYAEIDGIGMGLLSNGEPYLTQRGLAALCGVQNAHIGNIGRDWATGKPRVAAIQERLGFRRAQAHRVLTHDGHRLFAYDMAIAQAVLDYYALDVAKPEAVRNRRRFAEGALKSHILKQFNTLPVTAEPLRFEPVARAEDDDGHGPVAALLMQVWTLYVLSFWMAVNHIEELRTRLAQAPWNRLGFYLPLKAFLEIQAEVLRRNGTFSVR
ncbi:hypothetical protein ABI_03990 [Asticcacaulis biprosthecium C19]|uniref:Uncharacterized protein n=1 Tax=Asticcacaulis biprosthecium C19 TaxID=715226 RepID=F4QJL6_9CAUL|nr:hypothetical protein [Asticcacaulis biprosthecium]EGF91967.1 hypothetical protein ABI_03990 [Asticcacaulis biprosthecium C19]